MRLFSGCCGRGRSNAFGALSLAGLNTKGKDERAYPHVICVAISSVFARRVASAATGSGSVRFVARTEGL